jgi:hypothetical protein
MTIVTRTQYTPLVSVETHADGNRIVTIDWSDSQLDVAQAWGPTGQEEYLTMPPFTITDSHWLDARINDGTILGLLVDDNGNPTPANPNAKKVPA